MKKLTRALLAVLLGLATPVFAAEEGAKREREKERQLAQERERQAEEKAKAEEGAILGYGEQGV